MENKGTKSQFIIKNDNANTVAQLFAAGIKKDSSDSYEVVRIPESSQLLCFSDNTDIFTVSDNSQWSYITVTQETLGDREEVREDYIEGELVVLEGGVVENKEECQVLELEDGCGTLVTVDVGSEENNEAKPKKRAKNHYCQEPGCARSYTSLHHLKVHLRNHTGDRPYACTIDGCMKAFATDYSRKAHLRTHTGEKPYPCPYSNCIKSFKTSGDLHKHVRTHTGERPFACPVEGCNRSFTTSNIRKVHMRTHTGERPYICDQVSCDRTFASYTNYKNHMRIHSGEKPYSCPVSSCDKRFTEYSSLYKHQWVHSQQRRYQCPFCYKRYRQLSTLTTHKKAVHGIIAAEDGTELILEHMIGVGHDGQKNFNNITSNLLSLKKESDVLITIKEESDTPLLIVSQQEVNELEF